MWAVSPTGENVDFECDGIRYKVRPSKEQWDFPKSDVLVCSSYLGISCFYPVRERSRVYVLNGELCALLASGPPKLRHSFAKAELVVYRNPHEWHQLRQLGQNKHVWIPWGVGVDVVREKVKETKDIDVIGYTSWSMKRPEFVRNVFGILRSRGLRCEEVGHFPKMEYLGLLGRSKVFIHASITEGWARGIVEAAAAGCVLVNAGLSHGVDVQMKFFGGHAVSGRSEESVADSVERFVRNYPEGKAHQELPPEAHSETEGNAIARVVDRLLWCLNRGIEFSP